MRSKKFLIFFFIIALAVMVSSCKLDSENPFTGELIEDPFFQNFPNPPWTNGVSDGNGYLANSKPTAVSAAGSSELVTYSLAQTINTTELDFDSAHLTAKFSYSIPYGLTTGKLRAWVKIRYGTGYSVEVGSVLITNIEKTTITGEEILDCGDVYWFVKNGIPSIELWMSASSARTGGTIETVTAEWISLSIQAR